MKHQFHTSLLIAALVFHTASTHAFSLFGPSVEKLNALQVQERIREQSLVIAPGTGRENLAVRTKGAAIGGLNSVALIGIDYSTHNVNGNLVHTTIPMPYFADKIYDSTGDDNIYAGHGLNVIYATKGGSNYIESGNNNNNNNNNDDYIVGGSGRDVVFSGGMSDTVDVAGGNDIVYGYDGGDVVEGGTGQDQLAGRAGDDILLGDSGLDFVVPPLSEFDMIIATNNWPIGTSNNFHSPYSTAPMLNLQFQRIDHGVGAANDHEWRNAA